MGIRNREQNVLFTETEKKYPCKGLLLDLHYSWRLEGTERVNVAQKTKETVIKYK